MNVVTPYLDLYEILSTSKDYDELTYIWDEWRKNTGRLMIDDYETYVFYVNKAATQNSKYYYGFCIQS